MTVGFFMASVGQAIFLFPAVERPIGVITGCSAHRWRRSVVGTRAEDPAAFKRAAREEDKTRQAKLI